MRKTNLQKSKGMTLSELLISVMLGLILIGVVYTMWNTAQDRWLDERSRSKARVDLEIAMEKIKQEARLSSTTYMSFYPANASTYEALSLPKATTDGNGFFTLDANDDIAWDKSVIYHSYNNSGTLELRRTEFTDNSAYLTNETQRDSQLSSVVTNGNGSSAPNSGNSETETIIENLGNFTIRPQVMYFDGYNATTARSDNILFGSAALSSGNHELKFEVIGANGDSSGYEFGIDSISITPSGCQREAEVYSLYNSSGDSVTIVNASGWGGNSYMEYGSGTIGDYATFQLYYDAWLESNFHNSVQNNIVLSDFPASDRYLSAKLPTPKEGAEICWQAAEQTGDSSYSLESVTTYTTVRNILIQNYTDPKANQKLVRIKFVNSAGEPLAIEGAYIAERLSNDDAVGPTTLLTAAVSPGDTSISVGDTTGFPPGGVAHLDDGVVAMDAFNYTNITATSFAGIPPVDIVNAYLIGDYVRGEGDSLQLYFSDPQVLIDEDEGDTAGAKIGDDGGNASAGVNLSAGYYIYTNWAILTLNTSIDYFTTFFINNTGVTNVNLTTWNYTMGNNSSYVKIGNFANTTIWDTPVTASANIHTIEIVEDWANTGMVTSAAYDTKLSNPSYGTISWDDSSLSNTTIGVEARASIYENMTGASSWISVTDGGSLPSSMDGKRYAQFRANLTSDSPYTTYPWIDNVKLDWPGNSQMCEISGYFAMKSDYGQIKLTVDGEELVKGLEFEIVVAEEFAGEYFNESIAAEIEPRNTGK